MQHTLTMLKYSGKENPDLEPSIDRVIWDLVELIRGKYLSIGSTFRPLDFARIIQYFTLDMITSLSLSQPFGYVSQDRDMYGYVKTIEDNFPAMKFMGAVPILSAILRIPWVQQLALPTVKDKIGMGKVKG